MGIIGPQPHHQIVQKPPAFLIKILMRIARNTDDIGVFGHLGHAFAPAMIDHIAIFQPQGRAVIIQPNAQEKEIVAHHSDRAGGGLHLYALFFARFCLTPS